MVMRFVWVLAIGGCISDQSPEFDARDTTEVDEVEVTSDVAPDSAPDVATEVDSGEAEVDADVAPEVVVTQCEEDVDCNVLLPPECNAWTCTEGRCALVALSGEPCNDADACTGTGICVDGECFDAPALDCASDRICHRPACDADTGCIEVPVDGGVCLADQSTPRWGACVGDHMIAIDACQDGACLEVGAELGAPLDRAPILGDWFVVSQTVSLLVRTVVAGPVVVRDDHHWTAELRSQLFPITLSEDDTQWCLDTRLGLGVELDDDHFVGQVAPSGEAFAAVGAASASTIFALRPSRALTSVDGRYLVLMSADHELRGFETGIGEITFDRGCLAESAILSAGEPVFIAGDGTCLELNADDSVELALRTEDAELATGPDFTLYGAVGARGDALLFVRTKGIGESLVFGTLILVRADAVDDAFSGTSRWTFGLQEKQPNIGFAGTAGTLLVQGKTIMNGVIGTTHINGDAIVTDDDGGFTAYLSTPDGRRVSGVLAAELGFGFAFSADVAGTRPSFGAVVRRP